MTPVAIFSVGAVASFLLAVVLWLEERRTLRAVPRLAITTGVVRELETILSDRSASRVRSSTLVQVDFSVSGKAYCCRTLYLFAGNRHHGDARKKFDFPRGQQVGVHYDPRDPRRNALIVDRPRYEMAGTAVIVGAILAIIAAASAA